MPHHGFYTVSNHFPQLGTCMRMNGRMCSCNRTQLRQQCLQNEDTCLERVLNCLPGENELKKRCILGFCEEVEDEEVEDKEVEDEEVEDEEVEDEEGIYRF